MTGLQAARRNQCTKPGCWQLKELGDAFCIAHSRTHRRRREGDLMIVRKWFMNPDDASAYQTQLRQAGIPSTMTATTVEHQFGDVTEWVVESRVEPHEALAVSVPELDEYTQGRSTTWDDD